MQEYSIAATFYHFLHTLAYGHSFLWRNKKKNGNFRVLRVHGGYVCSKSNIHENYWVHSDTFRHTQNENDDDDCYSLRTLTCNTWDVLQWWIRWSKKGCAFLEVVITNWNDWMLMGWIIWILLFGIIWLWILEALCQFLHLFEINIHFFQILYQGTQFYDWYQDIKSSNFYIKLPLKSFQNLKIIEISVPVGFQIKEKS